MANIFEAVTADQVWKAAAVTLLNSENITPLEGRGGATKEILHAMFTIQDPRQRWVTARTPALNPAFAIAEVVWILNGRNDSAFLNYWNHQLPKYAGNSAEYHGAYGFRLRKNFGFDQLERAYSALRDNPAGRQVVLQIWDGKTDFPDLTGKPVNVDIPCNVMSLLKVRDNKLEWMQIVRSNDLFRGVPYNFIQFTSIQEVLAGWLGIGLGTYTHLSDSLHVYTEDVQQLPIHCEHDLHEHDLVNTESLCFPKLESERAFIELGRCIDQMIKSTLSEKKLQTLISSAELPQPFQNMLLVVAAETARRKGWNETKNEAMADCTNPVFNRTWENWQKNRLPTKPRSSALVSDDRLSATSSEERQLIN